MSITIYTYNDNVLKNVATDKWLKKKVSIPPIPANTVRIRTRDGNPPNKNSYNTFESATLVQGTTDIYDVYKSGTDFSSLLNSAGVAEVIGANIVGVTNVNSIFAGNGIMTAVQLFDTSTVTSMNSMFKECSWLTSVPLLDTSNVTDTREMFNNCRSVESGALALYNQMSTQTTPPSNHLNTFKNCGANTTTGAAELAQIPGSWGGNGPWN